MKRKRRPPKAYSLTPKEFHRALLTLDDLIQKDDSPKKAAGRMNRNKVVEALKEEGVTNYIANGLLETLIQEKVLRRGEEFVHIYNFVPFNGGEQITCLTPNEYLHRTESKWNAYVAKHNRELIAQSKKLSANRKKPASRSTPTKKPIAASKSGKLQLFGPNECPHIKGRAKEKLKQARYDVLLVLCEAGEKGLTKDTLAVQSKHTDAVGILRRLANSSPDWKSVIKLPGKLRNGYRVD